MSKLQFQCIETLSMYSLIHFYCVTKWLGNKEKVSTITLDYFFPVSFFRKLWKKRKRQKKSRGSCFLKPSFTMICVQIHTGKQWVKIKINRINIFDSPYAYAPANILKKKKIWNAKKRKNKSSNDMVETTFSYSYIRAIAEIQFTVEYRW